MNPDQQIELYRAARSIAWSYRLQDYSAAALKDLQRIVDKSKGEIINRFENQLGAIQREDSYTRSHYKNSLAELERLSLGLRNQLGEQLTTSTSRIGSLALKEWGENLSVGGVAKKVNTVALSPEQFAAFFKRNPPAGILIPKVMKRALNQGVIGQIEGELLDVLREGALTGQSYKRIVDKLSESFTDFNRHQLTTLTRTFFQTANAQAFDAVYQANQDIMEGKIWTNVNDDRVCLLCLPLGETLYKKGESHPPMPRHPNCRCVFRAKTVSYRSLGIDVDELEEVAAPVVTRGYEKNGKWIIPPAGTGTGRRPRAISFYQGGMKEAFPDLPEAQQKAMLGVGRYKMYKAGDLSIDQLVDKQTGKLYLLKELEQGMHLKTPSISSLGPPSSVAKIRNDLLGHDDSKEYAIITDSEGKIIAQADGIDESVVIPDHPDLRKKGANLQAHHNHPIDIPPSEGDIMQLFEYEGIENMWIHTPKNSYRMSVLVEHAQASKQAREIMAGAYQKTVKADIARRKADKVAGIVRSMDEEREWFFSKYSMTALDDLKQKGLLDYKKYSLKEIEQGMHLRGPDEAPIGAVRYSSLSEFESEISEDQKYSIQKWINSADCSNMRQYQQDPEGFLARKGRSEGQEYKKWTEDFLSAVEQAPQVEGMKYRGITHLDEVTFEQYSTPGTILEWDASSSFTSDRGTAKMFGSGGGGIIFQVEKAMPDISITESHKKYEVTEFIDPKGSKYEVRSVKKEDGYTFVTLKEIK